MVLSKLKLFHNCTTPEKGMFLPDRFVKGKCPKCYAIDQYGDNCEICGATYNQTELICPKSTISNAIPIMQKSEHLFFDLPFFHNMLYTWIRSNVLSKQVFNKIKEWFDLGLKPWNISRDEPYFGFKIPDTINKYFYVWLDAPIGYMSSFKNFCYKNNDVSFDDFWLENSKTELCQFIGKDIIYFHSLFWPALLQGSYFRKPTNLFVHGHVTVNGVKISKSHGTYIKASTYLKYLNPDCLRYYYAAKLSSNIDDIDLHLIDFKQKVNTDIVNKLVNLASRNASFINKRFNNQILPIVTNTQLYNKIINSEKLISELYNNRETNRVIREIMLLIDLTNRYIDKQAPWILAKEKGRDIELHEICSTGIHLFRIFMTYLKPILPLLAKKTETFLNISLSWNTIMTPLTSYKINSFKPLFKRIKTKQINLLLNKKKETEIFN